jgi:hypothetical protein
MPEKKIDNKNPANIILILITLIYVGPAPPGYRQAGEQAISMVRSGNAPYNFLFRNYPLKRLLPWT